MAGAVGKGVEGCLISYIEIPPMTVPVHQVGRPPSPLIEQGDTLAISGMMRLVPCEVCFTLQSRPTIRSMFEHDVDECSPHLILGRHRVHHLNTFHAPYGQRAQQGHKLRDGHAAWRAVEHHVHLLSREQQNTVSHGHTGQFFQRVEYIGHTLLLHHVWQVVDQCAPFGLHHGALAAHHHLGQRVHDTVHAQRVGCLGTGISPCRKKNYQQQEIFHHIFLRLYLTLAKVDISSRV